MKKELLETTINNVSGKIDSLKEEIAVFLVLNTKGLTEIEQDHEGHTITTEFFSLEEAQEFIDGFVKLGIYHEVYNGEKEFIQKLSSDHIKNMPYKHKIVYSSTGAGLARSKSALVPALCNLYNLHYCSNDIYTAALLENKVHVMNLLSHYGFPLPTYWVYDPQYGWLHNKTPRTDIKLIAKPAYECASLSITEQSVSFFDESYLKFITELAITYNQPIIVEEFIEGYEVEVPVFDLDEPLCPMTIGIQDKNNESKMMGHSYLTFEKVAIDNYTFYNFDAENGALAEELKQIAMRTFKVLNLSGIVRVDFRVTKEGRPYIMDYNNSPHLTSKHSCAFSLVQQGFTFEQMLKLLLWKSLK